MTRSASTTVGLPSQEAAGHHRHVVAHGGVGKRSELRDQLLQWSVTEVGGSLAEASDPLVDVVAPGRRRPPGRAAGTDVVVRTRAAIDALLGATRHAWQGAGEDRFTAAAIVTALEPVTNGLSR